jgi:hypothetical protein
MYDESDACEASAIIGFAIERTIPKLYQYIWDALTLQTDLESHDYLFFLLTSQPMIVMLNTFKIALMDVMTTASRFVAY